MSRKSHALPLAAPPPLVILDFDGVVADSELLSNTLLAEFLSAEGLPTTVEQSMTRYMGRRWADNQARIREDFGRHLDDAFFERYHAYVGPRMRSDVMPVADVVAFIEANAGHRFCVASSSSAGWLDHGTDKFGLRAHIGSHLFSATAVARGKPAPDIFLYAARQMGVAPHECVVVEDSPAGIEAAVAAGMVALGFLGGAHVRDGHAQRLTDAGATGLADTYHEVAHLVGMRAPRSAMSR